MKLFVGLGNPGPKYAHTRHSIGFMAVEAIAEAHSFGPWRARFQGEVSEGRLGRDKLLLLKPLTYMNESGRSVGEAMRYHRLAPEDVLVFHDELALAPGKIRVKQGGGHAGHNGLRSLHAHIGEGYGRVRLGIGHPGDKNRVSGYVLHDFSKAEEGWLGPLIEEIARAAPKLAEGDASGFMNAVALATQPPKEPKPPKVEKPAEPPAGTATDAPGPFAKLSGLFRRD